MKELTILMPCLDEAESIAFSIGEAKGFIEKSGVEAEILIADNGSSDGSADVALRHGARVIHVPERGYGNALRAGIRAAEGRYIIMGDCDGSYDFYHLDGFVERLRQGYTLVMGNRYRGGIEKGAMPFSHRYLGVPILSFIGRLRYKTGIGDFHCGLRGFERQKALSLNLNASGMEFATEIIGAFAGAGEPICEIPAVLRRDRRGGKSKLRPFQDALRHLKLMLFGI